MTSAGNTLDRYAEAALRAAGVPRFLTAVETCWNAVVAGLAADRAYHELIRLGATHEEAVREVLDQHLRVR
jgi:hypothetical protein